MKVVRDYTWFPKMFADMIDHARRLGVGLEVAEDPEAKLLGWASDEVRFTMPLRRLIPSSRYFSSEIAASVEGVCGESLWDLILRLDGRTRLGANMHRFEPCPMRVWHRQRCEELGLALPSEDL